MGDGILIPRKGRRISPEGVKAESRIAERKDLGFQLLTFNH
jgi:hypothetical protein